MLKERLRPSDCVLVYRRTAIVPLSYSLENNCPARYSWDPWRTYGRKASPAIVFFEDLKQQSLANRLFVVFSDGNPAAETDQLLDTLRSGLWSVRQEFEFNGVDVIEFGNAK